MKKLSIGMIVLCLFISGCYGPLVVKSVDPKPNAVMMESKQTLALEIEDKVADWVTFRTGGGTAVGLGIEINVNEWKQSLKNGFNNTFSDYYKIVDDPKQAELVLKIQRADVELIPAAVIVGGKTFTPGSVASIKTQINYKTKLTDAKGITLKQSANSAISKASCTKYPGVTPGIKEQFPGNLKDAIESMYELIVQEMFNK